MIEVESRRTSRGDLILPGLYAATLFVSSVLLFTVEPMVGKMILPTLGGTPAVWNTCVLFFQIVLLAGYAYAHLTTTWVGARRQAVAHVLILFLPFLVLPIGVAAGAQPPPADNPVTWLLYRLLTAVGLPFFVVSTSAPLLQRWFASAGHRASGDPYFLYVASNFGSLLALLAYPVVVEPMLRLADQGRAWTIGYALFAVMICVCAAVLWRSPATAPDGSEGEGHERSRIDRGGTQMAPVGRPDALPAPTTAARIRWVLLALVPSSLMLGVTAHITTNIAAVPLLWVIPLALYLLTFILAFARRPLLPSFSARWLPFVVVVTGPLFFINLSGLEWQSVLVSLAAFFLAAMACHGQLAKERPNVRYLTEYYLWISIGGALGGAFNTLVAPAIFSTVAEYPLAMVGACLLQRPPKTKRTRRQDRWLDFAWPLGLGLLAVGLVIVLQFTAWKDDLMGLFVVAAVFAWICHAFRNRPVRYGLVYAATLLAFALHARLGEGSRLHVERNFYGVKRIADRLDGKLRVLYHGTTVHGAQRTEPEYRTEPMAYYNRSGPVGDVFSAMYPAGTPTRIAVIGLGAGAMACYIGPSQRCTFYEIDPAVARIADDPKYFSYLSACRGAHEVVVGDGRLTLARAPDHDYGLIFLDAYGSDAIPTHLLSREALQLYLSKLADGGVLAFHISSRILDLESLLANLAGDASLVCFSRVQHRADLSAAERAFGAAPAHVVVMARRLQDLGDLATNPRWNACRADPHTPVWTDQYSNILEVVQWR